MTVSKAVSRKVVKMWHKTGMQVGIYEQCTQTIKLWEDRVTVKSPYVKWIGNTGGYAEAHYRLTDPSIVARLTSLMGAEIDNDADYTDKACAIVRQAIGDDY